MIKRVCDFCGRDVYNYTLWIGVERSTPLKIIDGSDNEVDVCNECCSKIKQICKNKELLDLLGDTDDTRK